MKTLRCLIALSFCLLLTCVSRADDIGFQMNILDPLSGGTPEASNTFNFSFVACSSIPDAPADLAGDGCFQGYNDTFGDADGDDLNAPDKGDDNKPGVAWTSLVMTFNNNSFLHGGTPSCGTLDPTLSIFATTSCSLVGNTYTLSFKDGSIAPRESFLIAESGVPPADFPTVHAVAGTAPEPNSIVLLSTGTLMFGMLIYTQRRSLQRNAVRS